MNRISPNPNSDAFHSMLNESLDRFFIEFRKGSSDFSNFTTIFYRFLQTLPDPPLEFVWFYAALTFRSSNFTAGNSSNHVFIAQDLFQLLVSCSSSCNAVKKIAVLAPVIYELHSLVSEGKHLTKEIESPFEVIVSYISICCGSNFNEIDEFGALNSCFTDLVRVWLVEKIGESCKLGEELRMFFPLVNDGISKGVMAGEGREVGYLAGIVMSETFLLRLCLKFRLGIPRAELETELRGWAVQTVTAFRSYYFVDTILRILLEPVLSVSSLLNSEEEVFLREILYDTAIMAEYSFLGPQKGSHLPGGRLKNLATTWLFVVESAIRFLWVNGNQTKVFSYVQAFSASCLPSQLIKWVMSLPGIQNKTSTPKAANPIALIKWLMILEDQGVRVFDCDISKICAKIKSDGLFIISSDGKILVENNFSYGGNGCKETDKIDGDLEMVDFEDTMFLSGPGFLKAIETNGTRKRKDGRKDEGKKQFKFVKCHLTVNSAREKVLPLEGNDALTSGSEVDDPASVKNKEYMEQ